MHASTHSVNVGAYACKHACTCFQKIRRAYHHANTHRDRDSYAQSVQSNTSQPDVAATNSSSQWEINILVAFGWTTTKSNGR